MKHLKNTLIALICASAMTFAACGDESEKANNSTANNSAANNSNPNNSNPNNSNPNNSNPNNSNPPPADFEQTQAAVHEFRTELSTALEHHYCHLVMTCPQAPPHLTESISRYLDTDGCLESGYMDPAIGEFEQEIAAIKGNRLKFDSTKAAECLAAIETSSTTCDFNTFFYDHIYVPGPCETVFAPQQADEEKCLLDDECLSGICAVDYSVCELGTCVKASDIPTRAGEGESCSTEPCAEELFCDYEDEAPTCRKAITVNKGEECDDYNGITCAENLICDDVCIDAPTFGDQDDPCDSETTFCKIGLTCVQNGDAYTCTPHSDNGGHCIYSDDCKPGLWCETEGDLVLGTCVEYLEPGQPCDDEDACGLSAFCDDLTSEPTCITYGDAEEDDDDSEICAI